MLQQTRELFVQRLKEYIRILNININNPIENDSDLLEFLNQLQLLDHTFGFLLKPNNFRTKIISYLEIHDAMTVDQVLTDLFPSKKLSTDKLFYRNKHTQIIRFCKQMHQEKIFKRALITYMKHPANLFYLAFKTPEQIQLFINEYYPREAYTDKKNFLDNLILDEKTQTLEQIAKKSVHRLAQVNALATQNNININEEIALERTKLFAKYLSNNIIDFTCKNCNKDLITQCVCKNPLLYHKELRKQITYEQLLTVS